MSLDVVTLALAKSYVDQHGGGGGSVGDITAEDVAYTYPDTDWTNAKQALDTLYEELYGGLESIILVMKEAFVTKPAQITSGSDITLADNTEYRLQGVDRLKLTYPEGNFECWMRLSFTDYGTINVTFPSTTQYIGTTPDFKEDETWELSIKDGVVIAQKVGDGI